MRIVSLGIRWGGCWGLVSPVHGGCVTCDGGSRAVARLERAADLKGHGNRNFCSVGVAWVSGRARGHTRCPCPLDRPLPSGSRFTVRLGAATSRSVGGCNPPVSAIVSLF